MEGCITGTRPWSVRSLAGTLRARRSRITFCLGGMNDHQVQKMDLPCRKKKIMLYRMKGYGQFCPVALAAEVFAERWTPLILRELLSGARRFADIHRGVPRISRNLLC